MDGTLIRLSESAASSITACETLPMITIETQPTRSDAGSHHQRGFRGLFQDRVATIPTSTDF